MHCHSDGVLHVGFGNVVPAARILAILSPESLPVKRLYRDARAAGRLVNATHGRTCKSVLVLDSGWVVQAAPSPATLAARLAGNAPGGVSEQITTNYPLRPNEQ